MHLIKTNFSTGPDYNHTKIDTGTFNSDTNNNTNPSSDLPIGSQYLAGQIPPTSTNIHEVIEVKELVLLSRNQTLDSSKLTIFHKTLTGS